MASGAREEEERHSLPCPEEGKGAVNTVKKGVKDDLRESQVSRIRNDRGGEKGEGERCVLPRRRGDPAPAEEVPQYMAGQVNCRGRTPPMLP